MFSDMLERNRSRRAFTVGQVAWRLGVSPREYGELEAGTGPPSFQTWDAIRKLYGWSQSFFFVEEPGQGELCASELELPLVLLFR